MTQLPLPPRTEHERNLRKSINLLLGLIRYREGSPPAKAALALVPSQDPEQALSSVYGIQTEAGDEGLVSLGAWCSSFIERLSFGLAGAGAITFRSDTDARLPFDELHLLALLAGELLVDSLERSFYAGKAPRIVISLEKDSSGLGLRICDDLPAFRLPPTAPRLAAALGGELRDFEATNSSNRLLSFGREARPDEMTDREKS
jgi:hypothetical protein